MKCALLLSFLCISIHAMALKDETPPVLKQLFAIYPFGSGLQPLGIFDTTVHNSHPLAVIMDTPLKSKPRRRTKLIHFIESVDYSCREL